MKRIQGVVCSLLVVLFWHGVFAESGGDEIAPGDSMARVEQVLGKPSGSMKIGAKTRWNYPDGIVLFRNDVVSGSTVQPRKADREKSMPQPVVSAGDAEDKVEVASPPKASAKGMPDGVSNPVFVREKHATALYFGAVPFEFDVIDVPVQLQAEYLYSLAIKGYENPALSRKIFQKMRRIVRKYPVPLLEYSINCVYCVADIKTGSESYAFLVDTNTMSIYLADDSLFDRAYGALLLAEYPALLNSEEWMQISEGMYSGPSAGAVSLPQNIAVLHRYGFVSAQAATGLQEDFSSIFAGLFNQPNELFRLAEQYELIAEKVQMTLEFLDRVLLETTGQPYNLSPDVFRRSAILEPIASTP